MYKFSGGGGLEEEPVFQKGLLPQPRGVRDMQPSIDEGTLGRVLGRYDLGGLYHVKGSGGGTANVNLVVVSPRGTFFLRRRHPRYSSPDQVIYEHALMRHLADKGVGGPLPVETRDGQTAVCDGPDVYELQHFVEGAAFDPESAEQLRAAARALAAFHAALDDFAPPVPKALPRYDDPASILAGFTSLLPHATPDEADGIRRVLDVAERLAADFPNAAYDALPHGIIHGDYHPANVLYRGDEVAGIFDLDWVSRQPRVRDLGDGITYFGGRRAASLDGADIYSLTQGIEYDIGRAGAFLDAYRESRQVAEAEVRAMPLVALARWLFAKVAGMRKVPEAERAAFALRDALTPVAWLEEHGDELVDALL